MGILSIFLPRDRDEEPPPPEPQPVSILGSGRGSGLGQAVLWFAALLACTVGIFTTVLGTSAIHEILAAIYFLIAVTALGAIAIIRAVARLSQ